MEDPNDERAFDHTRGKQKMAGLMVFGGLGPFGERLPLDMCRWDVRRVVHFDPSYDFPSQPCNIGVELKYFIPFASFYYFQLDAVSVPPSLFR